MKSAPKFFSMMGHTSAMTASFIAANSSLLK